MKRSTVVRVAAVVCSLLAILIVTAAAPAAPQKAAVPSFKLSYGATPPDLFDIGIFLAQSQHGYEKFGVNLKIVTVNGDTLNLQSLLSGDSDVAFLSAPLLYQAINQGAPIKAFLATGPVQDYQLVAKNDVTNLKGMEGRILATSGPGGVAETIPFIAMRNAGVDVSKVKTVNAGGSTGRLSALVAGRVDAALLHLTDSVTFLNATPGYHVLANMAKTIPNFQSFFWTTKTSTLNDRKKRAGLIRMAAAAMYWTNVASHNEKLAVSKWRTLYRPEVTTAVANQVWQTYKTMGMYDGTGGIGLRLAHFDYTVQSLLQAGLLSGPISYNRAIDQTIRRAALKLLAPKPVAKKPGTKAKKPGSK